MGGQASWQGRGCQTPLFLEIWAFTVLNLPTLKHCAGNMASFTTAFRPDSTCFAPSNLWLEPRLEGWGCDTYYPRFSSKPTEVVGLVTPPACPLTRLGRPANYDDLCYQDNWIYTGSTIADKTAYSACPEGMTGATTWTTSYKGITVEKTACCPT